jgi:hypothetical protein
MRYLYHRGKGGVKIETMHQTSVDDARNVDRIDL